VNPPFRYHAALAIIIGLDEMENACLKARCMISTDSR
jgi:hypothetical protein